MATKHSVAAKKTKPKKCESNQKRTVKKKSAVAKKL
jgi:hypothetical protein